MNLIPLRKHRLFTYQPLLQSFFKQDNYLNEMKIDIEEEDKNYILKAEVPGVSQDNLEITVKENTLTITVKREEERKEEKDNYIRQERYKGTSSRTFKLDNIDKENIEASFENGLLTLNLPKEEVKEIEVRKIEVK